MDSMALAAGAGAEIRLGGRSFRVRGRTVGWQAAIRAEISQMRGDPMTLITEAVVRMRDADGALSAASEQSLRKFTAIVAEQFRNWGLVTYMDQFEFVATPRGDALLVWFCIKHEAPEVTVDQVEFWLEELREAIGRIENEEHRKAARDDLWNSIFNTINKASGEDPLGNWQPPAGTRAPQATAAAKKRIGKASTSSSPKSAIGAPSA